jgi:ADP-ribosyl-[dinitrogen reductase] hydrolase
VEFRSAQQIAASHPEGVRELVDGGIWDTMAGQPTDDSELALMLARSIVQAGKYDPEAAARAYSFWYNSKPFDIGQATAQALSAITRVDIQAGGASAKARKAASMESQANGSLMRLSPLGIWGHALPADKLAQLARTDSSITHPNTNTRDAAAVLAVAIAHAISTGAPADAVYKHAVTWMNTHVWEQAVRKAVTDAARSAPTEFKKKEGWFAIALQNAFYQLLNAASMEEGVVATVMQGGDTDTNAAIAGALLGAVYGRDAVPAQWQHMILSCRPVQRLAGIKHSRPRALWPTDALELAELLLHIGKTSS